MMPAAPPGFRYIDIHTHLHPEWLWMAIRRWFAGRLAVHRKIFHDNAQRLLGL
jgi:predicted TIM-barrel fold metal-dependent hydrolase